MYNIHSDVSKLNLIGEKEMGKILTILRDNGSIDYKIDYSLFLFDNEIK